MIQYYKKLKYLIPLVVAGLIYILLIGDWKSQPFLPIQNTSSTTIEPPLPLGQVTKRERIDHIEWSYANGHQYPSYDIGGEDFIVTFYQWQSKDQEPKKAGLLIFKINEDKPNFIWESESIPAYTRPLIKALDVTGDGKNELLALWQNGQAEGLYIYRKSGLLFGLISPLHERGILSEFSGPDGGIQIADLDNDRIPEIWFSRSEEYLAYKWDGTKYFLWRKQQDPFGKVNSFN